MQLSETVTIYLAIGAPFGVSYFLRAQGLKARGRARSLLRATCAGLLWPFVGVAAFLARQSTAEHSPPAEESNSVVSVELRRKIETAERQLMAALERVRELRQTPAGGGEAIESCVREVREEIEKYVGLTLILAEADPEGPPASHEMELCRVAGRVGDDLLLAGRCIHRRNVARLIAHHAASRNELLHALARVRELLAFAPYDRRSPDLAAARHLSVALLKFYAHAINLLSLLEDEAAATSTARLLDAECARLRRLEAVTAEAEEAAGADGKYARHASTDWPTLAQG
jgi:hypothetical protein